MIEIGASFVCWQERRWSLVKSHEVVGLGSGHAGLLLTGLDGGTLFLLAR